MNKSDLKKLSPDQWIDYILKMQKLLLANNITPPTPPVATHVTSVKKLINDYENNIINPPVEFQDRPIPPPRTKKLLRHSKNTLIQPPIEFRDRPTPAPRIKQSPMATSSIKITPMKKALQGYALSFQISIADHTNPIRELFYTRKAIEGHLINLLASMKGFKLMESLKITFTRKIGDKIFFQQAYFFSRAFIILNNLDVKNSLRFMRNIIIEKINNYVDRGSGGTVHSVDDHYINIVKYQPVGGSSYIPLPKELQNSKKGLINMKNYDNQCFRWCHIRHLNPQEKYPQRIKKVDKDYVDHLDYSGIEFPVTTKHYNKIETQNNVRINVFGYENKKPYPVYVSKEKYENCMNLLLIRDNEKNHYVLIKDFNRFMYNQTKHKSKKHFCLFCLQNFTSEEILNNHKENCIEINGTQAIKMPDKSNNILKFHNFHRQLPVPFVIYADFEALTEKISGCQPSTEKSFTQAYQKHTDCGYGYKVVCCYDNQYTKPIKIYRGPKAVYKFMEAMLKEVAYCRDVIKKHFNKPL